MNWKINLLLLILTLASCKQNDVSEDKELASYLIEVDALKSIINKPNIKLIDFRREEHYQASHLPGALNIWRSNIENRAFPYKGMMPSSTQIEQLFGSLGIKNTDTLVIYDDNGLCDAARLWWVLQNYNFKNVMLLNGGISAWKLVGELTSEATQITKSTFTLNMEAAMDTHISKKELLDKLGSNLVIIDTRTADEYSGKRQKKGAYKGGRIPSSINIDWVEAINYNGDKRIKTIPELAAVYGKLSANKNDPIVVYCHSGVRSAHTTFVLTELLGYKNVRNYDGSWTEWSFFDELPFKQDSITVINK